MGLPPRAALAARVPGGVAGARAALAGVGGVVDRPPSGADRIADYLKSLPTEQLAFEESERAREGAEGELVKLGDFLLDRYGPQAWQPGELVADVAIRLLRERDGP
jgi:hypothetical protein